MIENGLYKTIQELLPIVCVDVLIEHNESILLLKRGNQPAKGQYWFPGGRLYKMESLCDAAIRKAKEETNLACSFIRQISTEETIFDREGDMPFPIHTVNICCLVTAVNTDMLKLDNLHTQYIWVTTVEHIWHEAVKNPLRLIGLKPTN